MTEDTDTTRPPIATRAISGAAWAMGLLVVLLPLRLVNATVISRTGGADGIQVFGFWIYLNMLVMLLPSLFLFGGPRVLVYFLPKCAEGSHRRFVLMFGALAMGSTLLGLAIVFLFPALRRVLGIDEHFHLVGALLVVGTPLQVATLVLVAALQGAMRLADAEKVRSLPQGLAVGVLIVVFLLWPGFALEHHVPVLIAAMGLSLLVTLVWALLLFSRVFRRAEGTPAADGFPAGLWHYAGYLHLNQLVDFIYMRADHWIVLYCFGFKVLAGYAVARRLAGLVGVIPLSLRGIMFSTFCQLHASRDLDRSRRVFRLSVLANNCLAFPVSLLLVCFSREAVGIISGNYPAAAGRILVLLAGASAVCGLGGVNASYIMSRGRSQFTFVVGTIGGVIQLLLTWFFLAMGGEGLGVAAARSVAAVLMLVPTTWCVHRLLPRAVPGAYLVGVACTAAVALTVGLGDFGVPGRAAFFLVGAVVVTTTSIRQMEPAVRRLAFSPPAAAQADDGGAEDGGGVRDVGPPRAPGPMRPLAGRQDILGHP